MTLDVKLENIMETNGVHGELYAQCCVCTRYRLDPKQYGENVYSHIDAREMVNKPLSHTYCLSCAAKEMKTIKAFKRNED